ncbi:probable serine/threonine-protein kinase DDB_G0271682 [Lineus longissimus]|uniref:probable serine/threonine-protein kinase DDB_G0271682 n=1 Tax=Lineus longissimus TaxID=88925 RepID=UPI00315D937B
MSGFYVDNAYNRSIGRVGMPMGSMVMSRGSSGGGSGNSGSASGYTGGFGGGFGGGSSGFSSPTRTYVDNSYNRSLGRVGMEHGTAVESRSSATAARSSGFSSSTRTYADNSYNRSLGRVGMEHGTAVASRSSAKEESSNDLESWFKMLTGEGQENGKAMVSKSSSSSISKASSGTGATPKTYVDNAYNQRQGRVGLERGAAVISKSASSAAKSGSKSTNTDNSFERMFGRDGLEKGTAAVSKSASSSNSSKRVYKDNDFNCRIGRAGLPLGSMKVSRTPKPRMTSQSGTNKPRMTSLRWQPSQDLLNRYLADPYDDDIKIDDRQYWQYQQVFAGQQDAESKEELVQQVADIINRLVEVRLWQEKSGTNRQPSTSQALIRSRQEKIVNESRSHSLAQSCQDKTNNRSCSQSLVQSYQGIKIDYDELDLKKEIGHGGFGVVHFAEWKGTVVAVKKLRVQRVSRKRLERFISEISIFCKLDHPNIVQFLGACVVTPKLAIVMEYMETSLFQKIHIDVEGEAISENEKLSIMTQVVSGLEYLHKKGIAHCDVKSHNVLLSCDANRCYIAKITDFGLSMMRSDAETSTTSSDKVQFNGTPRYSAPEVLRGEMLNRTAMMKTDVYSLGLVLYEVICEEEPFSTFNKRQLERHVGDGEHIPEIGTEVNALITQTVRQCWARDPQKRPSASALLSFIMSQWDHLYENQE